MYYMGYVPIKILAPMMDTIAMYLGILDWVVNSYLSREVELKENVHYFRYFEQGWWVQLNTSCHYRKEVINIYWHHPIQ